MKPLMNKQQSNAMVVHWDAEHNTWVKYLLKKVCGSLLADTPRWGINL